MYPVAVELIGMGVGKLAMPDLVGTFGKLNFLSLGLSVRRLKKDTALLFPRAPKKWRNLFLLRPT